MIESINQGVNKFGKTAVRLSKNPLGIIALFIVLVYGFASLVVGFNSNFAPIEKLPLIWFLVVFPILVLGVFAWLVSRHHKKLYGPGDYIEERNFVATFKPELQQFEFARPSPDSEKKGVENEGDLKGEEIKEKNETDNQGEVEYLETIDFDLNTINGREGHRNSIYALNSGFFLTHVVTPSEKENQEFDVFIYLIRHKSKEYNDIKKAEFFFGSYWGNEIYEGTKVGKLIGVKTSAYGEFLCTCRLIFKNGKQAILHRYIDFEMGKLISDNRG